MEEDVEIEMLFKSNEKLLIEAARETNEHGNIGTDQLEIHTLNPVKGIEFSCNKENITENMIHNRDQTLYQFSVTNNSSGSVFEIIDCNKKTPENLDNSTCSSDNRLLKQNKTPSLVNEDLARENYILKDADDEVNQRMLDLMSNDPDKYYFPQQTSYVEKFEGELDDDDDDDEYISTDDESDEDFGSKIGSSIADVLKEAQFNSLDQSQLSGSKTLQKLEAKAVIPLRTLAKMLFKRGKCLSTLRNQLEQVLQKNNAKQKELKENLIKVGTSNFSEPSTTRCFYRKFGMPYFSDQRGFSAPPNKDYQEKLKKDELMTELIPKPNNWTNNHKIKLERAIKESIIAERSATITKEITKLTGTGTLKQQDTDASKIIAKVIEKQNELRSIYTKSLKDLVKDESDNREYDWMKFSATLFDGLFSAEECKRCWNLYVKPSINKSPWSESEDLKLSKIAAELSNQEWDKIAELLGTNRSGFQCFVHYVSHLKESNNFSSGKWTKVEDRKLISLVNSSKIGDFIPWGKVSSFMGNRNPFQIYNRWANSLNPELVKGRFSKDEDILIVAGVEMFGKTFKEIALLMSNRTASQVRERYERHLLPKTAKVGSWSLEEDKQLLNLVQKYGANKWSEIAKEMKTRTRTQVRQRFGFIKKMRRKKPDWTIDKVKRRNLNSNERFLSTDEIVTKMKNVYSRVEKFSHLSEVQKHCFLAKKLASLKGKISRSNCSTHNRGSKKIEHAVESEVDNYLADFFMNCDSPINTTGTLKCSDGGPDVRLNEYRVANFFGHELKLPTKKEILGNPNLNCDSKFFLVGLLNTRLEKHSPMSSQQQASLPLQLTVRNEVASSTPNIDCPIPVHDDTIMMNDWWHMPTVNYANLNFSEFYKRTVFDFSIGMHQDIWDSKVKRFRELKSGHNHTIAPSSKLEDHTKHLKENLSKKLYNFPPNQFTCLSKRSFMICRGVLERWEEVLSVTSNNFIKEEIFEEGHKIAINLCYQLQDDVFTFWAWPKVFANSKVSTFSFGDFHSQKKNCDDSQPDLNVIQLNRTFGPKIKTLKEGKMSTKSSNPRKAITAKTAVGASSKCKQDKKELTTPSSKINTKQITLNSSNLSQCLDSSSKPTLRSYKNRKSKKE